MAVLCPRAPVIFVVDGTTHYGRFKRPLFGVNANNRRVVVGHRVRLANGNKVSVPKGKMKSVQYVLMVNLSFDYSLYDFDLTPKKSEVKQMLVSALINHLYALLPRIPAP
ncbi:hypothetical protein CVT26_011589 [Gymnopilus dilepis]|uniref:Uncharacterized protein n=1 Tax=Gymnopilus dilepis TaxID=231916 RepID=A0A409VY06_9AGAR|nr:hypothetical protein CVT26_011589 [Gymnopilus dilepis]